MISGSIFFYCISYWSESCFYFKVSLSKTPKLKILLMSNFMKALCHHCVNVHKCGNGQTHCEALWKRDF